VSEQERNRLAAESCGGSMELCVPLRWLDGNPIMPEKCRSLGDAEGRCLSVCLPKIAAQAGRLPRAICQDTEVCAPCFDPLTGVSTGACDLGDDPGPSAPATVLGTCCESLGRCVPDTFVSASDAEQLDSDVCANDADLCVPTAWLDSDGIGAAPSCRSWNDAEGRCLPACLPVIADQASRLRRDVCDDGLLCAPCYDPVSGNATGACSVGSDSGPLEPKKTFDDCCRAGAGALGRCVPKELLSAEQHEQLPADECDAAAYRCAPVQLIEEPSPGLTACRTLSGAGACVPACMIDITDRALLLRNGCADGELCVPCSGLASTGLSCPQAEAQSTESG
jgi:hypothetical protein